MTHSVLAKGIDVAQPARAGKSSQGVAGRPRPGKTAGSMGLEMRLAGSGAPGENRMRGAAWSLSTIRINAAMRRQVKRDPGARAEEVGRPTVPMSGRRLSNFPHRAEIEWGLGMRIPGHAVVDAVACQRQHAEAFSDHDTAYFSTDRPSLLVASHEAVHLAQHAGATRDASLGAEGHASLFAHRIAQGRSARSLIGPFGAVIPHAIRRYTEVPIASQTATEWDAKMPIRLADDGRMAVGEDSAQHSFWAESALIAESNAVLTNRKSVIRLDELATKISGAAPVGGGRHDLSKVSAKDLATATEGDAMNIWADCGKSARDVMGAGDGAGTGGGKMTASFQAMQKPPKWLKYLGGVTLLLSGTPVMGEQHTNASDPAEMKKEIFNEKLGGTGDEGLKKYEALSPAEKEQFDKETQINRFAAPKTGQGYTMSSGGAPVPGNSTWNFHWAGVVMNSGNDRVTLENYSVSRPAVKNSDWIFQMYGAAAKAGQTFYEQHKASNQHGDAPTAMQVEKQ